MLHLFGCGALGKSAEEKYCVNIRKIRERAIEQNVWPVVYSAIRKDIESKKVFIPDEVYLSLERAIAANIAKEIQRTQFTEKIIQEIEKNGVKYCLLKGCSLASLYAEPETRTSSDTDIIISEVDEQKTAQILMNNGYETKTRLKTEHHMEARHPIGGVMEVHVSTMQKKDEQILFGDELSFSEEYIKSDNGLNVLGINDGLINVTTHFIKHFMRSGAGVRHMMDMLLYMKKYEKDINWESFNEKMKKLRYDTLIETVKSIGEKYWGIEFGQKTSISEDLQNELLTDIENGGVFGNDERHKAYSILKDRRNKGKEKNQRKEKLTKIFRTIFPDREYVKKHYSKEYRKYGIIYAYIKRLISFVLKVVKKDRAVSDIIDKKISARKSEVAIQRISLMENLGVVEKE